MDIHKPKPVHSLREFLNEIAIIIIGVLIALGLEQAVEQWHWHNEVVEARESLRKEMTSNLRPFRYGIANSTCALANLDQFEKLVQDRDVAAVRAATADGTWQKLGLWQFALSHTVWDAVNASSLMAHMPSEERLIWAGAYGEILNEDTYKKANWLTVLDLVAKDSVYDGSPEASRELLNDAASIALFERARVKTFFPDYIRLSESILGLKPPEPFAEENELKCRPLQPDGHIA